MRPWHLVLIALAVVAVGALFVRHLVKQKRCPVCRTPRRLKGGMAHFCPKCGHWYDRRLGE